ncbi:MAG: hypothetical protein SLAVMIC_00795 [uncultured marine phage]|uniref:Uncharacterized protein n=1 Tax=uncultured marine phage TaxID=707152 RepID=A0A8D9FSF4_9VIRU|nr:MAG: hypothetical protein SLAVMIC_00795 [uncultured marine phage]
MYNFVSSHIINQEFKKSKYYKVNLGRALSVKENDRRVFRVNDEDLFVKFYLQKYNAVAYSEGTIGQINFLVDHHIKGDIIVVFYKEKDFLFEHNTKLLQSKGIDGYIGSFIEEIETTYADELELAEDISIEDSSEGNSGKISINPGDVSYEDIKKYVKQNGPIKKG